MKIKSSLGSEMLSWSFLFVPKLERSGNPDISSGAKSKIRPIGQNKLLMQ